MIAFTEKKQALHDKMANCLVVNKNVNSLQIKQDGQATALSTPAFVGPILLALAISVSGILAPIIIPAYQNYKVRTQQGLSRNLSQFPFSTEKSDLQPKQLLTPLEEKNQKANAGDVLSQFELGTMYAEGQGVKRDYGEAIKWFQLAAQQGNKESQLYLGLM